MRVFSADNLFEKRLLTEFDNLLRTYITVPQEDASQPWPGSEAVVKASARPDGHKDNPAPVGVKSPVGALLIGLIDEGRVFTISTEEW